MSIKGVEPRFGEVASRNWEQAADEWTKFGTYQFPAFNQDNVFVQLEDMMSEAKFKSLIPAAQYWTERWSNDTNYRYWKSRSLAESQPAGVESRRLFYEATRAFKSADFQTAADNYKRGLELWKSVMAEYPSFEADKMNQEDTAFIVKRYALALRQLGTTELPADTPFIDLYELYKDEAIPVDPHDALEILGRDASAASSD
jgi:hypothetical protein